MIMSHRISRRWHKKSPQARGKIIKARDKNFPRYRPVKRQKRWFWNNEHVDN